MVLKRIARLVAVAAAVTSTDCAALRDRFDATRSPLGVSSRPASALQRLRGGAATLKEPMAFLLDIDGTLCMSDDLYFDAFKELLTPKGFTVDAPWYAKNILGKTDNQVFTSLFPKASKKEIAALGVEKDKLFCKMYRRKCMADGKPPVVAGLEKGLQVAKELGIVAIACTNAPRGAAEVCIQSLKDTIPAADIIHDTIIIGAECKKAKPHPEPYLRGAKLLGFKPERCIVFEDSGSGVTAGVACGAKAVVGLATSKTHADLKQLGCTITVDSWKEITPDVLRSLAGES